MLYLIKSENIFVQFYGDIYTIKYQKYDFLYIYLLILLNPADKFLKTFYINEVIYAKLPTVETNFIDEFTKIKILVILHGLYGEINLYLFYINNIQNGPPRCTKYYLYNFFKETSI